jgi:hypothetical protein
MARKGKTADAVEILHRRYFKGKPERLAELEEERANASITKIGLDLVELAERLEMGNRLCAATADETMRREYQEFATQLGRTIESFKTKLDSILTSTPMLTPELRHWALTQATEDEIVAGISEVRAKGGTELGAVIQKLKQKRQVRGEIMP